MTGSDPEIGRQLATWGKVAIIETRGRVSGQPARAAVGFLLEAGGSILVAAGDPDAAWARNLEADARCLVTIGEVSGSYDAEPLAGPERNAAIAGLILRYGTPAERLGRGPTFRLRPAGSDETAGRPGPDPAAQPS
jgi:deazaflavin-dependent oxidoreductase (nitroreductase family)